MRPETRKAMEKLYSCEWRLTDAAKYCNLTMKEMKITFNEYCGLHPPTYDPSSEDYRLNKQKS